jgi:hypothetical protein
MKKTQNALLGGFVSICTLSTTSLAGGPLSALAAQSLPTPGSGGNLINALNDPFSTRDGRIGFTGNIDLGGGSLTHFVWVDGQIVWQSSDGLPTTLTGAESTMGISDDLNWIYSPSENGNDSVWSNGASLLKETDPAPGLPGLFISFCSRPQMTSNGIPTWVSGITATQGGGAQYRALYAGSNVVLKGGDVVSGESLVTAGSSLGFAYDFSSLGTNYIVRGLISAPSTSNDVVIYNGEIIARESQPSGAGDNWQNFGEMKANEVSDFAFSGDTDAAAASDGYLAFNDELIVREGQTISGFTLSGNPSAVGLNDVRQVGAIWSTTTGEILFVITPSRAGPSVDVIMKTGDGVDINGDSVVDGSISDFNASTTVAPGLDLPRQCRVCASVDVELIGGGNVAAIVCAQLPPAPGLGDFNGDGAIDGSDLAVMLGGWGGPGITDLDCDGTTGGADLAILLGAWS